jgi:tetrahydromethanopterin S-methyltransferase subunit E
MHCTVHAHHPVFLFFLFLIFFKPYIQITPTSISIDLIQSKYPVSMQLHFISFLFFLFLSRFFLHNHSFPLKQSLFIFWLTAAGIGLSVIGRDYNDERIGFVREARGGGISQDSNNSNSNSNSNSNNNNKKFTYLHGDKFLYS